MLINFNFFINVAFVRYLVAYQVLETLDVSNISNTYILIELHLRENLIVKHATLMHIKCPLTVSIKSNSIDVGNSNEQTIIIQLYATTENQIYVLYKKP